MQITNTRTVKYTFAHPDDKDFSMSLEVVEKPNNFGFKYTLRADSIAHLYIIQGETNSYGELYILEEPTSKNAAGFTLVESRDGVELLYKGDRVYLEY